VQVAAATAQAEGASLDAFSVVLVDNDRIQQLNRELLGADWPTDVIAFEAETGPDGKAEAEAYISVEQATIQAAERGRSVHWELAFLIAHAVLHALGYRDHDAEHKQKMLDKQNALLKQFEERISIGQE